MTPKAPMLLLLVPRVAAILTQAMVWTWESKDRVYRQAPRVTRHWVLPLVPQSTGDREFVPRDPQPPGRPLSPRPCVLLCPHPASVFRTKWKVPIPLSGYMRVPIFSPHPDTEMGRPVGGQPHPHRSSPEREPRLGEVNRNKSATAAPGSRGHASLE